MKTFKKAFVVTVSCLLLLTGCDEENNQVVHESGNISSESESTLRLETLDDLIRISDNIVIGTVTDEEQFSEGSTYKFTFTIDNELKGNVEAKSIDVYEAFGDLKKGKEYILFLESWESELYPNPVYTSYNKDSFIEVDQDALIGGEMFVGQKTKDEMIEYIKSSKEVSVFSEKEDAVIEKAKDLAELISLSDHILHIVPKDLFMKICM